MIYAYRDAGRWTIASMMPRFNGIGGWHTLTDEERAKHGWYPCVEVNANYNPTTQIRSPAQFVLKDDVVTASYTIWDKPDSQVHNEAAEAVRSDRNSLIADTDWMALSDNAMSPQWAEYRQALRDITEQEGFPYAVIWPTKPE
jgi:hypothetical protein